MQDTMLNSQQIRAEARWLLYYYHAQETEKAKQVCQKHKRDLSLAIAVEALMLTDYNPSFASWLQSWHTNPSQIPDRRPRYTREEIREDFKRRDR